MNSIRSVAFLTFKEGLRHRVLYGAIVASMLIATFAVLICSLFLRDILKVLLDICLSAMSVGGLLIPFFLGISLLAGDLENNTVYTILAKNVSRTHYLLGKYVGLCMLTATIMSIFLVATLLAVYCASVIYPPHNFVHYSVLPTLYSALTAFMGVCVLNSIVILWCAITTSSFLATLLVFSTYVIGQTTADMVQFISSTDTGAAITPMARYIVEIALYVFPNLSSFDFKQQAAYSLPVDSSTLFFLGAYSTTYIAIMLFIAAFVFRRRDL